MKIHERVLEAAVRIGRNRRGWTFRPSEIVAALPDLNPSSVRTHVMSRCCVNAPEHHAHRHAYFKREHRGVYSVLPAHRSAASGARSASMAFEVRETAEGYAVESSALTRSIRARSLDAAVSVIRELAAGSGSAVDVRILVRPEPERVDPVIATYAKDVDRASIRENLRLGVEERLTKMQQWQRDMDAIRGKARPRRRSGRQP